MNKFARIIHEMAEGKRDIDTTQVSLLEREALTSLAALFRTPTQDLATHLAEKTDPTDWLVPPPNRSALAR